MESIDWLWPTAVEPMVQSKQAAIIKLKVLPDDNVCPHATDPSTMAPRAAATAEARLAPKRDKSFLVLFFKKELLPYLYAVNVASSVRMNVYPPAATGASEPLSGRSVLVISLPSSGSSTASLP